uniref:Uncharacterized protein n=1 Tax=Parascaris univalens TaxID=6257 RepID=A0A915CCQ5_PARUN
AGKRKAALPKKRPAALEGPVNISADTGEVEEDSTSAAAEIVLGVDESGPVTRTGSKRLIAYRKKPATSRLAKSTTSEVIDDEKSAVGTNIDCNLLNAFPLYVDFHLLWLHIDR